MYGCIFMISKKEHIVHLFEQTHAYFSCPFQNKFDIYHKYILGIKS